MRTVPRSPGWARPTPPRSSRVIGASHRAARDAGPLTWDEGPAGQWLGRKDRYSYLAGDDGFAAYLVAATTCG